MPESTRDRPPANPSLHPLGWLIGRWATVGSHPQLPGTVLRGRASCEWLEDGAFLRMRTWTEHPQVPDGVAIIGSDDALRAFSMLYFDERGVSRRYELTVDGTVVRWWRDAPDFSQRYTWTLAADGRTMRGVGELSRDGTSWEPDLELTYTRDD